MSRRGSGSDAGRGCGGRMDDEFTLSRREFARALAAAALTPQFLIPSRLHDGPAARPPAWDRYGRAMVIDCLASPGPFNTPNATAAPLTEEMISNARSSGITAVNLTVSGNTLADTFERMGYWERELAAHPDVLMKAQSVSDIRRAKDSGRLGLVYGFQNATMLEGDVTNLEVFYNFGVRIVQLTYNERNLLGDGCLEPANAGLSRHGRDVVARMNELGMLVDLAHCGVQTTADGIAVSSRPVAITHSGCRAVYDHPRSKPDDILRALANKGGVIGIYMMPFLTARGQPTSEDLLRHIEHAVNVCGEDHVGIGSDLSITPHRVTPEYAERHRRFVEERQRRGIAAPREEDYMFVTDLNSPRRMEMIADKLLARGHAEARVEKIIGGNWMRLFGEVWKA
ncbi:MAG TPA: membrane dipeptidase [Gemmatimonadales bacterium]|nr:membrane dipeptidase [Gemmatimonadales bacterium]